MSDIKNKFDLNHVINNIKSMINPAAHTPNPKPDDAVGIKIAELSVAVQQLQESHVQQAKQLTQINKLFNELYVDLEAMQQPKAPTEKPAEAE